MFQNCIVTVYEQINPFDAFGQIMCNHFKRLGSPLKCILKYPTQEDQTNRYLAAGFSKCVATRASDFYRVCVSIEEKSRIDKIELFDEYEPWHLKCSHYTLISATKGEYLTKLVEETYEKVDSNLIDVDSELVRYESEFAESAESLTVKTELFPIKFGARFGHSICAFDSKLFIFGGFGELTTDGKHLRQAAIEVIDLNKKTIGVIEPSCKSIGDRIFFCSTLWNTDSVQSDEQSIVISYGRSNPSKLFNSMARLNFDPQVEAENLSEKTVTIELVEPIVDDDSVNISEMGRFRHTACVSRDSKLFIYGGKVFEQEKSGSRVLNDCYVMDKSLRLKMINLDEEICLPRHSHSMVSWGNFLVISGGVDSNENPLNDVILLDVNTYEVKKVVLAKGHIFPR